MSQAITERIHELVRKNLPRARKLEHLESDVSFRDHLGARDLDMLQLTMDCEDEWDGIVYIDDEEHENLRTVGDLEALVVAKLQPEAVAS